MSFALPQTATFWNPTGNNGTGGKTYSLGAKVPVRIADIDTIVFTAEGKQQRSKRVFYSTTPIPFGAYVVEGDFENDAAPAVSAQLVIHATSNPSITNMNKAMV